MKIFLIIYIFFALFISCSPDSEENTNLAPRPFEVDILEVTDRSATITWTSAIDPEGQPVNYIVVINEEDVYPDSNTRSYNLTDLNPETNYSGKVIATDGPNRTIVEFTFLTEAFTPKIHNGYVMLTNQAEVNAFGAQGYNIINGSLGIESRFGPMTNISDLTPLRDLIEVKDYVQIRDSSLKNLQGLNQLTKIGGYLGITYNSKLENIEGLEGVQTISGSLGIHSNPQIIDLAPLESATSVGEINIGNNENLKIIRLLSNSVSVDHIYIYNNPTLEVLEGFERVQNIKYDIEIIGNSQLKTIPVFEELLYVNFGVSITKNGKIEKVDFPKLKSVIYGVEITENPMLIKIDFKELRYVGHWFLIWHNPGLSDFCSLSSLINEGEIGGSLSISGNAYNPSYENIKDGSCMP